MDFKSRWKFFWLKRKAQHFYRLYLQEKDDYRSAGNHLAQYMNPRISLYRDECNRLLDEMAKYDDTLGDRKLT